MSLIIQIWNLFFYLPFYKILYFLYIYLKDFGLAIICMTFLVKIILSPLSFNSLKTQQKLAKIQLEMEEIEKKFKGDSEKKAKELISLYQREKINPFSNLFVFFIQVPIFIALYQVLFKGIEKISPQPTFLGFLDLSKPNILLVFLAAVFQFFYSKKTTTAISLKKEKNSFERIFQNQMAYFFPFLTFIILLKLPAVITLYWLSFNIFSFFEYRIFHARKK